MRLKIILLTALLLLGACTTSEPEQQSTEKPVEEVKESNEGQSPEEALIAELPADAHPDDWNLILVNPWEALPENFTPLLVEVDNEQRIDQRIEEAWQEWKHAGLEAGHRLFFASGYRDVERQRTNFDNQYQAHLNEGYSEEEALEKTKEYLTEPGHSEHHTGLALDLVDEEWIVAGNGLDPEYDTQASQHWLVETMADYGFILRYPEGKEEITGIQYESWHFRYVGQENARFIEEHDLVLEEYLDLLQQREAMDAE